MSTFTCPKGHEIRGTIERIEGIAAATPTRQANGTIEPEYHGYTEVDWNTQRPIKTPRSAQLIWECVDGCAYPTNRLIETPDDV